MASDSVEELVRANFIVKDRFALPEGNVEYRVEYAPDSKDKFVALQTALSKEGLVPRLAGTKEECVLTVAKEAPPPQGRSRIPIVLALLTLVAVVAASLLEWDEVGSLVPSAPGYAVALAYGACVGGVLVARELAHRLAARRAGSGANSSLAVPGIPGVTAVLPTLGFLSVQRSPAVNRDRYFDVMLVGPFVTLAAAVVLEVAKGIAAYASSVQLLACTAVNSFVTVCPLNPSILQAGLDRALALVAPSASAGTLLSPVGDAATVAFLLVFVGVLPMAAFDGGHLSSAAWGSRGARAATYLSVLVLIVLDTPFYWGVAIVVLLLAGRPVQVQVLDEVSALSKNRRLIYLVAIVIAFMCVPIPQNLATVPL